jgi:hypothetical protein
VNDGCIGMHVRPLQCGWPLTDCENLNLQGYQVCLSRLNSLSSYITNSNSRVLPHSLVSTPNAWTLRNLALPVTILILIHWIHNPL